MLPKENEHGKKETENLKEELHIYTLKIAIKPTKQHLINLTNTFDRSI